MNSVFKTSQEQIGPNLENNMIWKELKDCCTTCAWQNLKYAACKTTV
jgi:hypothetical protein